MTELSTIATRRLPEAAPPTPANRTSGQRAAAPGGGFADVFAAIHDGARPVRAATRDDADAKRPGHRDGRDTARSHDTDTGPSTHTDSAATTSDAEPADSSGGSTTPDDDGTRRPDIVPDGAIAALVIVPTPDGALGDAPDGAIAAPAIVPTKGALDVAMAAPVAIETQPRTRPHGDAGAGLPPDPAIPIRAAARSLPTESTPPDTATSVKATALRTPGTASAPTPPAPVTRDGTPQTVTPPAVPLAHGGQPLPAQGPGSVISADATAPADTPPAAMDGEAMTPLTTHAVTPRDTAAGNGAAAALRLVETTPTAAVPDVAADAGTDIAASALGQASPAQNATPLSATASAAQPAALPLNTADPTGRPMPAPFVLQTEAADWMSRLVDRIGSGATAGIDEIEMTLTPRNLGSLTVRIDLRETAASVAIVTETPEAARLFNDQQGKLADLLGQSGLSLADHRAGTGGGAGSQGQGTGRAPAHGTDPAAGGPTDGMDTPAPAPRRAGLVDLLA